MKQNGLEIATDLKHQKRLWIVERIGWAVMVLLMGAGLMGLLGAGPLSHATAGKAGSELWVDYQKLDRCEASSQLRVHVGSESLKGDSLRLWVSRQYLDKTEVEKTTPEAEHQEAAGDRVVYVFRTAGSNEPIVLTFHVRPTEHGKNHARIGIVNGPEVHFSQFIYP
jgi:hypothetical protein